ncbi:MAG: acyl-CoA dehydrogenase family protein [Spongiibacter sp.]|nr:acyl-CoA dehydrogenase family protein [Spongiibacter sp.]
MRELFDNTIRAILADQLSPEQVIAAEGGEFPRALWNSLEENGVPLALVAEDHGGVAASLTDVCGLIITCGEFSAPLPIVETMLANYLLARKGLPPLNGVVSFAAGDELVVNAGGVSGSVANVPWGRHADLILAPAGQSLVVLATGSASRCEEMTNTAGEARDTLFFDGATPEQTIVLDGPASELLLLTGALIRSAQTTGAIMRVLTLAKDYANERVQFGKPIGRFQAVQHQMALLAEQAAMAKASCEVAFARSAMEFHEDSITAAKICAADAAGVAASVSHGVHGAIGFTHEYTLHISTRRLWSWRSEFGSATYWCRRLGDKVCKSGAEQFWPGVVEGGFPSPV